jgi:hypothetical protein
MNTRLMLKFDSILHYSGALEILMAEFLMKLVWVPHILYMHIYIYIIVSLYTIVCRHCIETLHIICKYNLYAYMYIYIIKLTKTQINT